MPTGPYRHPRRGALAHLLDGLANARRLAALRRAVLARLPFVRLRSEVSDVVYLNWLVPVALAQKQVPAWVRLWQREGLTPFSILSYRHRHFGPALLGPLRRCLGSPLQSNWRFYLQDPPNGAVDARTVLFTHNALGSLPYALGARMFSDALPADLPARFVHQRSGQGYRTEIDPGEGSAPALSAQVRLTSAAQLPPAWQAIFGSWQAGVDFLALQDAAVAEVQGRHELAFAQIDLPIDTAQVRPAELLQVACPFVEALAPVAAPWCFAVPKVPFTVCSERLLPCAGVNNGEGGGAEIAAK